jgi:hypothetical protein
MPRQDSNMRAMAGVMLVVCSSKEIGAITLGDLGEKEIYLFIFVPLERRRCSGS